MSLRDTASDLGATLGVGALAGLAGTAAMTVSSTLEAKARGRGASETPAVAAGVVLGVEAKDDTTKKRFNNVVHWAYGTGWGTVRGLLDFLGLSGAPAAVAHLAAVWGGEQVVLPATAPRARLGSGAARKSGSTFFITVSTPRSRVLSTNSWIRIPPTDAGTDEHSEENGGDALGVRLRRVRMHSEPWDARGHVRRSGMLLPGLASARAGRATGS